MDLAARGDGSRVCASAQEGGTKNSKLSRSGKIASERADERMNVRICEAREKLKIVKCNTLSHPPPPSRFPIAAYPEVFASVFAAAKTAGVDEAQWNERLRLSLHARV